MNHPCEIHTAKIEQIFLRLEDLREDLKTMHQEDKDEHEKIWTALDGLKESIVGNGREGLKIQVDRNTNFRKNLIKLLWALFTPLYAGLITIILKIIFNK
jgi:hypothetical protein